YRYDGTGIEKTKAELENKLFIEGAHDGAFPMRPRRIVADCRRVLGPEDIICMDNGIYKLWFARHYKTYNIGTFLIDNALATMGAGLPSAMAAKLVNPDRRVLAVVGDGGFMMNAQEFETAVRLKLPVVILILNDNAYGFIKWKQQVFGFADYGLDVGNPDFVKFAESHGAAGYRVESAENLVPALELAFKGQGPVIVECLIDYSENIQVWNRELHHITCYIE
ncbi:MAG: acetolactate synthase large subunit, partial [Candidatus Eisenbacteria bacterium]|nr:acetolactate synthase large subunit [Candidatus Eisenbacteria bacterium]